MYSNEFNFSNQDINSNAQNNLESLSLNANQNKSSNNFNLQNSQNPRAIWGAVVTLLHKQNYMALFTACGEIREIKLEGATLVINIREEFLYNTLTREDNLLKLTSLLKQVNNNLDLKFNLIKKKDDKTQVNLKRLTEVFGKSLEIID